MQSFTLWFLLQEHVLDICLLEALFRQSVPSYLPAFYHFNYTINSTDYRFFLIKVATEAFTLGMQLQENMYLLHLQDCLNNKKTCHFVNLLEKHFCFARSYVSYRRHAPCYQSKYSILVISIFYTQPFHKLQPYNLKQ